MEAGIHTLMRQGWHSFKVVFLLTVAVICLSSGLSLDASAADKKETVSSGARLGGDKRRTRFVADLSKKVSFRIFTLSDPYRVIVDLPDVNFQMPENLGKTGRGLIHAFRFGRFAPGKSRIVIDVAGPFLVDKSFVLGAGADQPARLVIDLVPTDKATFLIAQKKLRLRNAALHGEKEQSQPKDDEVALLTQRKAKPVGDKPIVVIDPGHGGLDSGAVSVNGIKEKDLVLDFAAVLKNRLQETGKYKVHMTRSDDTFIPLTDRVQIARHKGAGLLISIHADSLPRRKAKGVRGATVYTLSEEASDDEAKALAAKENRSDILAGLDLPDRKSPVSSILIDLAQRVTKNESIGFANMLLGNLKGTGRLNKKPHRFANLRVLRAPDVPSVLLELGYLSSKDDEKLLKSRNWQTKVSDAIVRSVNKYFSQRVARRPF